MTAAAVFFHRTGGYNTDSSLWIDALKTYAANVDKVRLCPSTPLPAPTGDNPGACDMPWSWAVGGSNVTGSYSYNGWLYSGDASQISQYSSGTALDMFLKQGDIDAPALTPVIQDSVWVDFWPMPTDQPTNNLYLGGGDSNPGGLERCCIPRHGGMNPGAAPRNFDITQRMPGSINMALSDGHVEGPQLENLWKYMWNKKWVVPVKRPGSSY